MWKKKHAFGEDDEVEVMYAKASFQNDCLHN